MSNRPDPSSLGDIGLFRGLAPDHLSWLDGHLRRRTVVAGANIVAAEQPGEVIYIILSGTVKIHVEQANGTDVILAILGPGDIVGEMSLLDGTARSADVVTLEETTLLWMDRDTLHECLQRMPVVATNMMRILCDRLRQASEQIQSLAALGVRDRVLRQILVFAQRYGRVTPDGSVLIPIRLTQSDIAGLIGASRERVNQIISACKRRQQLSVDRDYHITVHDREALARQCQWLSPLQDAPAPPATPV